MNKPRIGRLQSLRLLALAFPIVLPRDQNAKVNEQKIIIDRPSSDPYCKTRVIQVEYFPRMKLQVGMASSHHRLQGFLHAKLLDEAYTVISTV